MACILPPSNPLFVSICMTSPHLEIFIYNRRGSASPYSQPNPPHIYQTPLHVCHYRSYFPSDDFYRRRRSYLKRKSYLMVIVMEGVSMVPKFLHLYYTSVTTTLLPFSPYDSLFMPTMWNFSW